MRAVIIVFSVLGLSMFGAWLDFSPSKRYLGDFVKLKYETNVVTAVEQMDAVFMANPEYKLLKEYEYERIKKDFNSPPNNETYVQLDKIINAKINCEQSAVHCIFRLSILFRIIDESLLDPRTPSKKEVADIVCLYYQ